MCRVIRKCRARVSPTSMAIARSKTHALRYHSRRRWRRRPRTGSRPPSSTPPDHRGRAAATTKWQSAAGDDILQARPYVAAAWSLHGSLMIEASPRCGRGGVGVPLAQPLEPGPELLVVDRHLAVEHEGAHRRLRDTAG